MTEAIVDARFCGPPGCGNGGYVAGLMAQALGGVCAVSLKAPTPLAKRLQLTSDAGRVELKDGDRLIARAESAPLDLEAPAPISPADAARAMARYAGFARHAFPRCFVCGPERAEADGLRIFPGPVEGRDVVAALWRPDAGLADDSRAVRPEFLWAALDCPGYFAIQPRAGPCVLGRFTVAVAKAPKADEAVVVAAWALCGGDRKYDAGSALYDQDGALLAKARATWVRVRPGAFEIA